MDARGTPAPSDRGASQGVASRARRRRAVTKRSLGRGLRCVAAALTVLALAHCAAQPPQPMPIDLTALPGWHDDDQSAAVPALRASCALLPQADVGAAAAGGLPGSTAAWRAICTEAARLPDGDRAAARAFFERRFVAVPVASAEGEAGLFTGYYVPEVRGARQPDDRYDVPLYRLPPTAGTAPLPTRAEIAGGALAGQGLELLWLDDAVDAFFLEIQGSGVVRLPDGTTVGVGVAGTNDQTYVPIGRVLAERGVAPPDQMSMQIIRAWLRAHPDEAQQVMNRNPRKVFFALRPDGVVRGSQGAALTPGRSLAVDRAHIPLGLPLWLDIAGPPLPPGGLRRLVVAQDTGGAIRGAVRGDLFWGYGAEAGERAGVMRAVGRYFTLVPRSIPADGPS